MRAAGSIVRRWSRPSPSFEIAATRQASELRGAGDAESARIYAEAHGQAPEFYGFLRRLEAYRKTIGSQTTLVLPPDNEFFELLESYRAK